MRLENKVALITGGASGMGASMARIFAREGARVAVADMLEDEGRQVAAEITQANGGADTLRYYGVPGMAHCQGGPATDQFDALVWFEETTAVTPLDAAIGAAGAGDETFPFGL